MVVCDIGRARRCSCCCRSSRRSPASCSSRSGSRSSRCSGARRRTRRSRTSSSEEQLDVGEHALARRVVRHVPARVDHLLAARRARGVARRRSTRSRRSRSTRRCSRSSSTRCTFLVSALIVWRLPIPRDQRARRAQRIDWTETFRDIKEGLQLHRDAAAGAGRHRRPRRRPHRRRRDDPARRRVREAGPRRRQRDVRCADDRARRSAPRSASSCCCASRSGCRARPCSSSRSWAPACSSCSRRRSRRSFPCALCDRRSSARARARRTSPGSPCCRRSCSDELRGRTFATLYTVIRLCLLISLVISPLWADFWDWVVGLFGDRHRHDRRRDLLVPGCAHRALGRRADHVRRRVLGAALGAAGRA